MNIKDNTRSKYDFFFSDQGGSRFGVFKDWCNSQTYLQYIIYTISEYYNRMYFFKTALFKCICMNRTSTCGDETRKSAFMREPLDFKIACSPLLTEHHS